MSHVPSAEPAPEAVPQPLVSVVMPCLDEEEAVGGCVREALGALRLMGVPGEVLVVDNGSTDGSAQIAAAAGARVVREDRRGYGAAYQRGFGEARGRFLVMGDADGTYPFTEIPRFVDPLRADECDVVMGDRLGGDMAPGAMSWSHRWIGNPILSGMLRLFFHTGVSDSHCGMRAFTREAYERMNPRTTGMEFASELVVNALRSNLRIREIPIRYRPRLGESKLAGLRDAWRHVRFMLLFSPSYLFQLPALALLAVGMVLILALAGGPRELFGRVWDYHPLLFGCLAVILGYNLLLFDAIAKAFSMEAGFARPGRWLSRLLGVFRLERGLLLGGLALIAGLGLEAKIVFDWMRTGFRELMAVRGVVLGITGVILGLQTIFASFLLSLVQIERMR
jgi:glycosyltransferase involved in cell wall biosynthesis